MAVITQEQKDIATIKEDMKSIREHLNKLKQKDEDSQLLRGETNRKLDLLVNSLTDNDYNGGNGYLSRLNKTELKVQMHELYWRTLFVVFTAGGILALGVRFLIFK